MWLSRCVLTFWFLEAALAARILAVFPTPSISHQVVFRALTQELAGRGHELLVLNTDAGPSHPNITEINMHNISYSILQEHLLSKLFEAERSGQRSTTSQYRIFMEFSTILLDAQLSLPEVQSKLFDTDNRFDLILLESHARSLYALRHRFRAPLIAVSSFGAMTYTYNSMGLPSHPILFPGPLSTKVSNLSLFDRIRSVYEYLYSLYIDALLKDEMNQLSEKYFGEDTPSITELESQTDMLILNVNPIWDGIKVTSPNVIFMSGAHLKDRQELPADLRSYLDGSSHGVVYMSLGSNMKSSELSAERLRVLVEAFRRLPYDVLWKWETDELPDRPDNVRIAKWLPQADLLRHPNVKAFVTQGGLQSTDEALNAGVPLVGIPMFGDQEANVEKYVLHGVGVGLNINTLTADQLVLAIKMVAEDEKYREAVQRMARLLADGDVAGGVERAAWWVEYVLRHGGARHLRSPAAGVTFIEYYMLDVLFVVSFVTTILFIVFIYFLYYVFAVLLNKGKPKFKRH